ncbi:hypothetical protein [Aliarcobacter butzleri]|uniref:hypothetical protein n=1 Tax=Aliarcobacter butzleri TaxID=28197 RepID=UPI0021B5313C|nr:hypothetical protein [Aliarcobacter butzleri]MCT7569466.1 hypothetical protein [Aliarcobacter butzleri]
MLSAISPTDTIESSFLQIILKNIVNLETIWKQNQENNTKYLVRINDYYYFCKRINNKIVKKSLKTKNLNYAVVLKNKILENLEKEEDKMGFFEEELRSSYQVFLRTQDGDDPQNIKEINKEIQEVINKHSNKFNKLEIIKEDIKTKTIEEGFIEFVKHKEEVDKLSKSSLDKYKNHYNFLLLFCNKDKEIHTFNSNFFKEIQQKIQIFPNKIIGLEKYKTKKYESIMKDFKDKEYEKLTNKTINDIFKNFKLMFDFFKFEDYIKENVVEFRNLKEITKTYKNFEEEEINLFLNNCKDTLTKDIFDIM